MIAYYLLISISFYAVRPYLDRDTHVLHAIIDEAGSYLEFGNKKYADYSRIETDIIDKRVLFLNSGADTLKLRFVSEEERRDFVTTISRLISFRDPKGDCLL